MQIIRNATLTIAFDNFDIRSKQLNTQEIETAFLKALKDAGYSVEGCEIMHTNISALPKPPEPAKG